MRRNRIAALRAIRSWSARQKGVAREERGRRGVARGCVASSVQYGTRCACGYRLTSVHAPMARTIVPTSAIRAPGGLRERGRADNSRRVDSARYFIVNNLPGASSATRPGCERADDTWAAQSTTTAAAAAAVPSRLSLFPAKTSNESDDARGHLIG